MFKIISTNILSSSFQLECNHLTSSANPLFIALAIVILPALLINGILHSYLELRGIQLLFAISVILLILMNIAFYIWNKTIAKNRTLVIGFDEMKVFESGQLIYNVPFEELEITNCTWGIKDVNLLPAISLQSEQMPPMTIGSTSNSTIFLPSKKRLKHTNFILGADEEWNHLLKSLDDLIS